MTEQFPQGILGPNPEETNMIEVPVCISVTYHTHTTLMVPGTTEPDEDGGIVYHYDTRELSDAVVNQMDLPADWVKDGLEWVEDELEVVEE